MHWGCAVGGFHGDGKSDMVSALLVRIIRIAPRLYDYHGLSKFRNPISSSLYPFAISSAWIVLGLREGKRNALEC